MTPSPPDRDIFLPTGSGPIPGEHYLPSRVGEVSWGWLPNAGTDAVLTVPSGATVTIDTVSHEGLMEDQGRDPLAYLAQFGVSADRVLDDLVAIAAGPAVHGDDDGPHIVTGPVGVVGARPGDLLAVDVLTLDMRAAYGFISNRHGLGALPGEFPEDGESLATRAVDTIVTAGTVSHFATVEHRGGAAFGRLDAGGGRALGFPLAPFLGLMGVAAATDEPVHSVPPGAFGGNIDIKHITAGARMYLPVQVDGALFYTGDPHFAQGNGEVALTAFEAPLRATLRLSVLTGPDAAAAVGRLRVPVVETATHWIPTGMDVDLNAAMRHAVRNAIDFLDSRLGVPRPVALAYLSAAADFEVTQVVDSVKGIHCMIRKADFAARG